MDLPLPPLNPQLVPKIEPRLMKDTYKKVHIYLFDFDLLLGKGSFSKVYKGINLNTNEQVAVKVVEMSSINTPKLKQLLLQEIDILMKIKNENLIKCFEVLSSAKNTYIVMELCTYDFGTICDFILKQQEIEKSTFIEKQTKFINTPQIHNYSHSSQKFPFSTLPSSLNKSPQTIETESLTKSINSISSTKSVQIQDISEYSDGMNYFRIDQNLKEEKFYPFIKQIFQGLEYLQNESIVHRDLKLSNIFLTASKACKIGDFGFATIIPSNQVEIKDTCCIGSPLYMSPESYVQNVYSLKSDIWSFGILIFEMIYGNPPHWNCPTHEILKTQIKKQIDLKKFQKLCKISDDLKEVIEACLQVDIRKRFSIKELKETRLFKRLFYQPLESNVIVSSRKKDNIEQSSVQVLGHPMVRNDSIKAQYKNFEYTNYSSIEKVKQVSIGLCVFDKNRFSRGQQNLPLRKPQKVQTFMPNLNEPFQNLQQNSSFTDRPSDFEVKNQKRAITSTKIGEHSYKQSQELNDMKFNSTDLNGNIFKEINLIDDKKRGISQFKTSPSSEQKQQFIYKNSEEMQRFLKEMKETRKTSTKNASNLIINESPITFTDLTNVLSSSKNQQEEKEEESPKFATTFSGRFFNSPKHQKIQKVTENRKSTQMLTNYSMFENVGKKIPKPSTSYSPRSNLSLLENPSQPSTQQPNKENQKEQTLVTKNYSCNSYSGNKNFSMNKESQKYEYKKKMLDKCISTPKFETYQNDPLKKTEEEDKNIKYMTTSSFFVSTNQVRSPRTKNPSASNLIKDFNLKEELSSKTGSRKTEFSINTKSFEEASNLLYQFSSKAKQPSQIHKKTYWKGCNGKNFIGSSGEKSLEVRKQQSILPASSQNQNSIRNHSNLFSPKSKSHEHDKSANYKPEQHEQLSNWKQGQSFKLLNGQLIIRDACELIHFSRLLHKISFMTENNANSILLLQYSVQILKNLLQKCDNFQIKYHYDTSTNNPQEIRETFKSNDLFLNNLITLNEKQCYAFKRESLLNNAKETPICNKTLQLKTIIESYIKKYLQRKEALIKLFECNILFENLTNKVKQAKLSNQQNLPADKPTLKKSPSMNCEKGLLNLSHLEKVIEEIETQLLSKKQNLNNNKNILTSTNKPLSQILSNKQLLKTVLFYIEAIQRCLNDHSFMGLIEFVMSRMTLAKEKIEWEISKENKVNEISKNKSLIERLLEGSSQEIKNHPRSPSHHDSGNIMFGRNYSVLVGISNK